MNKNQISRYICKSYEGLGSEIPSKMSGAKLSKIESWQPRRILLLSGTAKAIVYNLWNNSVLSKAIITKTESYIIIKKNP